MSFFTPKPTQTDPNAGQFYRTTVALPEERLNTEHYAPAQLMGRERCLDAVDAAIDSARINRNGSVSFEIPMTGAGGFNVRR